MGCENLFFTHLSYQGTASTIKEEKACLCSTRYEHIVILLYNPRYRFSQWIPIMFLIIPHCHLFARVRVAILAQMRAGVVFPDVFAQDLHAEEVH